MLENPQKMNVKFYGVIAACAVGALIAFSIVGKIVENSGIAADPQSYRLAQMAAIVTGLILFFVISYAGVPLVVRFFILAQIKIGNGEHPTVKFLTRNEKRIVYGFWIFFALGSLLAVPAMIYNLVPGKS